MDGSAMDRLKFALSEIGKIPNEEWMGSLEGRKKKELEFHDKDRDSFRRDNLDSDTYERFYGNRKYYAATKSSQEYRKHWITREVKERVFLDYCCGNGVHAIFAAGAGAKLAIGIDLSSVSINNARSFAEEAGVSKNTYFVQSDAEDTKLPANSIDRIICDGVLHHLDITKAMPELYRILRPGGKIMAIEALDYNPAIKLYRHLTPDMRTEWEKAHILSLKDVNYAKNFFEVGEIRFWHILAILEPHFRSLGNLFHGIDKLLTRIPLLQLMAWIFTFELIKPSMCCHRQ